MKWMICFAVAALNGSAAAREPAPARDVSGEVKPIAKEDWAPQHLKTQASLERLEQALNTSFKIPFPSNLDIDVYKTQPLGRLSVTGGEVLITRPLMNPYDDRGSIEWLIGPKEVNRLAREELDAMVYLDESGQFLRISLLSTDGWSSVEANSQLSRKKGEAGPDFLNRAVETYRSRAAKAENPELALLLLQGFEVTARKIQKLRAEQ